MIYIAIIGDLISSKTITNRPKSQKQLQNLLNQINKKYKELLKSAFTITTGDEFQALLVPNPQIFQILMRLHLVSNLTKFVLEWEAVVF